MLFSLIPFTKLDLLVGASTAFLYAVLSGSLLPAMTVGLLATFCFSLAKDYFSLHRIKTTLSIWYDTIKEKIFGANYEHEDLYYKDLYKKKGPYDITSQVTLKAIQNSLKNTIIDNPRLK